MNGENQGVLGDVTPIMNKTEEQLNPTFEESASTMVTPMNQQVQMMNGMTSIINEAQPMSDSFSPSLNEPMEILEEEDEEEEVTLEKTAAELELEVRNKSGLRFIMIFGLLVLIFIILLPFLITIF